MTGNVYCSLLGIFIVSVFFGSIEGHPHRSPGDQRSINREIPSPEMITYNRTQSQQLPMSRVRKSAAGDHESRMVARVFRRSSDSPDNVPTNITIRPATECKNTTFCEYPSFYPEELINRTIPMRPDLQSLSTVDTVGPENGEKIDGSESDEVHESLCDIQGNMIYPRTALNNEKEWMYIINGENFIQGVRIEQCITKNTACSLIEGFSSGYETMCKQKYVIRELVALASNGTFGRYLFRFPASCCCHVKLSRNPLASRLGIGANKTNKQTPALRIGKMSRETREK